MKILKTCAFAAALFLGFSLQLAAQAPFLNSGAANSSKALLFSDLPDSLQLNETGLATLLDGGMQASTQVQLSPLFQLQGKIVSAAHNSEQKLTSVVLKSSNRLGAVFTPSRTVERDGRAVYTGRVLSRSHADAWELVHASGTYYLVKRSYTDLVEE